MKILRLYASAFVLAFVLCGCTSTVIPTQVRDSHASFDGNQANSGFLRFSPDGSGVITPHARDRYNALAVVYGKRFSPALHADDGITALSADEFQIDSEHLVKFATMNRWRKQEKP